MTDTSATGGDFKESVRAKADEVAGQAQQLGDSLHGRATDEAGTRSTQAGEQLGAVSDVMREASQEFRDQGNQIPAAIAEQVADRAERFGRYLRESSGEKLFNDAQDLARQQPWVVAALGLAAGLAVARLLKASGRRGYGGSGNSYYTATTSATTAPRLPAPPPEPVEPPPAFSRAGVPEGTTRPWTGERDV